MSTASKEEQTEIQVLRAIAIGTPAIVLALTAAAILLRGSSRK